MDNSDYSKPRTKLFELLPDVFQSDVNKSLFANLYDRYLTKDETTRVIGYIGKKNNAALYNTQQIPEVSLHRQGHQLQPYLYAKVGAIDHISSWEDLLREAQRLGVDREKFDQWGRVQAFNWVPPIDLDKLIHYGDYYWYDPSNTNSLPQYITVRNQCSVKTSIANAWQRLVDRYGEVPFSRTRLTTTKQIIEAEIKTLTITNGTITIAGDLTDDLHPQDYFDVISVFDSRNTGRYRVITVSYDSIAGITTIVATGPFVVSEQEQEIEEDVWKRSQLIINKYDQLILDTDGFECLFEPGLQFHIIDTENQQLQNILHTVESYVEENGKGIVTISSYTTDGQAATGTITFNVLLQQAVFEKRCACGETGGFDVDQWDPLPGWDSSASCEESQQEGLTLLQQWSGENKWLHKLDVPNFTIARRAQYPIIEYNQYVELNQWTYTRHKWQYRKDFLSQWEDTLAQPTLIELAPITLWQYISGEYVLDSQYGDLTDVFTPGTLIRFGGLDTLVTIKSSRYYRTDSDSEYCTRIKLEENVSSLLSSGNLIRETYSRDTILPYKTSQGDPWGGYNIHWLYVGADAVVPTTHQVDNPYATFASSQAFNYQQFISAGQTDFLMFEPENSAGFLGRSLRRRALAGYDDVRVYVDQRRQYGTYEEIGNTVLTITKIKPGQRQIVINASEDFSSFFSAGDKIRVYGNYNNATNTVYTVQQCSGNTITVVESIPSGASSSGFVYNITTPIDEVFTSTGQQIGVRYVAGVRFFIPLPTQSIVDIFVGESAISEIGLASVPVFFGQDVQQISLISYRKTEQEKATNAAQYPLFDMYDINGQPLYQATPLFAYNTSSEAPYNPTIGQRIVIDQTGQDYEFEQFLYNEESDDLYAYRDYSTVQQDAIIYDTVKKSVLFWNQTTWAERIDMNNDYRAALIQPDEPEEVFEGLYWFNTLTNQLLLYNAGSWNSVDVTITDNDPTLTTIWRAGNNNEQYIPQPRDWQGRTEEEYLKEQRLFILNRKPTLMEQTCGLTEEQAEDQLLTQWYETQKNPFSPTGVWVGSWDGETNWGIPDPLFFNTMHENKETITYRELLTHFSSIIDSQDKVPGQIGTRADLFHMIPYNEINYGVGGTIKEFNSSVDTFYSSLFVENVTPPTLFEFAQQQYEVLLNNLQDIFRKNYETIFTTQTQQSLVDFASFVVDTVISVHEENDFLQLVYGDSTTFTDIIGTGEDSGIRNWIATLPYIGAGEKQLPLQHVDNVRGINQVVHHDTHRNQYQFPSIVIANISAAIINFEDTRFPQESIALGHQGNGLPPYTLSLFAGIYGVGNDQDIINREGVYWYDTTPSNRRLYRFSVATISETEPQANTYPEGALWVSLIVGYEGVYRKIYIPETDHHDWEFVGSSLESAWEYIDFDQLLIDVIFEVEQRLYNNVPSLQIKYNFEQLRQQDVQLYDSLLEQQFNQYVLNEEILSPYINTQFDRYDPFTWNYRYSTVGERYTIKETSGEENAFFITGNFASFFSSGTEFYVKNSVINDGRWTVETSEYLLAENVTKIRVDNTRQVQPSIIGIIYKGMLPSSANDGSETAAYWQAYYQQLFNTPYPHLEPWKLQGYTSRPSWWNDHYLNDEPQKWGNRRWKYKHGFDVVAVNSTNDSFTVEGNFLEVFNKPQQSYDFDRGEDTPLDPDDTYNNTWITRSYETVHSVVLSTPGVANTGRININGNHLVFFEDNIAQFVVVNSSGNNPKYFTIVDVEYNNSPPYTSITVAEEITSATGLVKLGSALYRNNNRTVIYVSQNVPVPQTGLAVYARILVRYGMWDNINRGVIPPGELYSNGIRSITGDPQLDRSSGILAPTIPTYSYLCVNVDNRLMGTYNPDDVFAPYWDYITYYGGVVEFDAINRSLFYNYQTEVQTPSANYLFGDQGPVEWDWRTSTQYLYDQLTVAYKLDPITLISSLFGFTNVNVGQLQIDTRTQNVPSHTRTAFHGELIDNQVQKFDGLNQWYVNYNRYHGFDTSYSDFRPLWTQWETYMTYAFSSFVDQQSVFMSHRFVPLSEFDRRILAKIAAKRSAGVRDFWLDAFNVSVIKAPPAVHRYDNQAEWEFEVRTNASVARPIEYYDVERYQYYVDTSTNTCWLNSYSIRSIDHQQHIISVFGDQTVSAIVGLQLAVRGTLTSNDGTYTIVRSVYDDVQKITLIEVEEQPAENLSQPIGFITIDDPMKRLTWSSGILIRTFSDQTLPVPLDEDKEYFVRVLSSTSFQFARTRDEAIGGIVIPLTSVGRGNHYAGLLHSTFHVLDRTVVSKPFQRYVISKNRVKEQTTPFVVKGIQTLIDLIYGYAEYRTDEGWYFNNNNDVVDPTTGRIVSWELEVERFLEHIYGYQARIMKTPSTRFDVSVEPTTSVWTFKSQIASFVTGDEVGLFTSNGNLPPPFNRGGMRYYIIRDSETTFRLAATRYDAERDEHIEIDQGEYYSRSNEALSIYRFTDKPRQIPAAEINPFRNGVAFKPTVGVLSNLYAGPTQDIRVAQLLFDQYGRPLPNNALRILREDKQTTIRIAEGIINDVSYENTVYNNIHLGGAHIFIDVYEHTLLINDYTTENNLMYDSFLGLYLASYDMQFERYNVATFRPNVGGFFLHDTGSQEFTLVRNIEASVEDLRKLYDTHTVSEFNNLTRNSRKVLGYEGMRDYFSELGMNSKSQFLFWKGMLQHKGSINTIKALANSRRIDYLDVDEFWAIKDGEFGDAKEREYPEVYLTTADGRSNDLKLLFVDPYDFCPVGYATALFDNACGYAYPEYGDVGVPLLGTTFTAISGEDRTRWHLYPDQMDFLRDNGFTLYFNLRVVDKVRVTVSDQIPQNPHHGDGWADNFGDQPGFYRWNAITDMWENHGKWASGIEDYGVCSLASCYPGYEVGNYDRCGYSYPEAIGAIEDFTCYSPIIRHNLMADDVALTLKWHADGTRVTITNVTGATINQANGVIPYIPKANNIIVFRNKQRVYIDTDYQESDAEGHMLLSSKLVFVVPLVATDVIDIVYGPCTLKEDVHYEKVNSDIIRILNGALLSPIVKDFTIWGLRVNERAHSPVKFIDTQSETVIETLQYWDPARGIHYNRALQSIDIFSDVDPAQYTFFPSEANITQPGERYTRHYNTYWGKLEVGQTWLDTSTIQYTPYYDRQIFTDVEYRVRYWGQLAGWSVPRVYEWIESDVSPAEYVGSGVPHFTLISSDLNPNRQYVREIKQQAINIDCAVEGRRTLEGYQLIVDPIHRLISTIVAVNYEQQFISIDEDLTYRLFSGMQVEVIDADDVVVGIWTIQSVEGGLQEDVPVTVLTFDTSVGGVFPAAHRIRFYPRVDVYVNGSIQAREQTIDVNGNITVENAREQDQITLLIPLPTPEYLAEKIEQGIITIVNEFVYEANYDQNGNLIPKYYFWVTGRVSTQPTNNHLLSPYQTQQQLVTIPAPYVLFEQPAQEDLLSINNQTFAFPKRMKGAVIHGLRGRINEDMRYILRFTRDFTLRDLLLPQPEYIAQFCTDLLCSPEVCVPGYSDDEYDVCNYSYPDSGDSIQTVACPPRGINRASPGEIVLRDKDYHEEWILLREKQVSTVPRWLWNKVIEAIVGYHLYDSTQRVPSYDKQLYDEQYGTATRFGFGEQQALVDGQLAYQLILQDLQDPNNDFTPINLRDFFDEYSFDTPENIIESMNAMYNTFAQTHINRMFFKVVHTMLALKRKYSGIFKTSFISVHMKQQLQTPSVINGYQYD